MKVDWNESIGGVPMLKVRDTLRAMGAGGHAYARWTAARIAGEADADVAQALAEAGYLEVFLPQTEAEKDIYGTGGPYYQITDKAMSLALAKKLKRINRARADIIIDELLNRADAVNADADLLYRVERITAFGSYATDTDDIGDLDLCFELARKLDDFEAYRAAAKQVTEVARDTGRSFANYGDELYYPERLVRQALKANERYLSPMWSRGDLDRLKANASTAFATKQIYPRLADYAAPVYQLKAKRKAEREFAAVYTVTLMVSTKAASKREAEERIAQVMNGSGRYDDDGNWVIQQEGLFGDGDRSRGRAIGGVRVTPKCITRLIEGGSRSVRVLVERRARDVLREKPFPLAEESCWPEDAPALDPVIAETVARHVARLEAGDIYLPKRANEPPRRRQRARRSGGRGS